MNEFFARLPEFAGRHALLLLLFAGVLLALAVTELLRLKRGWKELTPAALTHLINRENALVVDMSAQADFEKGHVPGARHVAPSQFDPENKALAKARDLPVVVVCKNGQASSRAAARLVKAGFTRVHTLAGGLAAWRQADMPVERGQDVNQGGGHKGEGKSGGKKVSKG